VILAIGALYPEPPATMVMLYIDPVIMTAVAMAPLPVPQTSSMVTTGLV